jgi:O-antigen/teichoic acid export membrane protein
MSVFKRLAGHSLVYIVAAAVNGAAPFLLLPFLTRALGPQGFGTMGAFLAMVSVCATFVGLNAHAYISAAYFRDGPETLSRTTGAAFGVLALSSLVVLACFWIFSDVLSEVSGVPAPWLWTVWASACGQFVLSVVLSVRQVRQQPFRYAAVQVSYTFVWVTLTLVLIGVLGFDWLGRALALAITAGVTIVVAFWMLNSTADITWRLKDWQMADALRFGVPLVLHSLAAVSMISLDKLALTATWGQSATGQYYAAFQMASVFTALAAALNQAWIPWLYSRLANNEWSSKWQIVKATYALYALLLGGALFLLLLAKPIVGIIAGDEYAEAASLLKYLAPAAAFSSMYYFCAGSLFYKGRTGLLSLISAAAAAVQAALIFLMARWGPQGVAISVLCGAFLYWAMTTVASQVVAPLPWSGRKPAES